MNKTRRGTYALELNVAAVLDVLEAMGPVRVIATGMDSLFDGLANQGAAAARQERFLTISC